MATKKKESQNEIPDWQRQAWLAEYQVCQREASDAVSSSWQSGIIFFVTTLALAGTAISGLLSTETSPYRLLLTALLGAFSVILLLTWKRYLTRQHLVRRVMLHRMQAIEKRLNLRKCSYVSFLDETIEDNPLTEEEKAGLLKNFCKDSGRKPQGFKITISVIRWLIGAWVTITAIEALVLFVPEVRNWLFN